MPIIKINSIYIWYETQGCDSSPWVIFNNGILMNAKSAWEPQVQVLSKHYRLLKYDFRGQGDSEHPKEEYTMELHADDLAELMSALKINKAHIVGLSYGGMVAQTFAVRYPQLCSSLILAGTTSEVGYKLKLIIKTWLNYANNNDPDGFFNATVPWFFTSKTFLEKPHVLGNTKTRYTGLDFEAVARLCRSFLSVNLTSQLDTIKVPTCIVVGDQDLLTEQIYTNILHKNIPINELHILSSSGHVVCWEQVEGFNTVLLGFLLKQTAT
ncbi:alpha/beta fold hydrolase [Coleofasciculus sp. E2-BRE-01]|uniref:alpha/beta fold hydrolase n=1 Tax=Coleofasciculus sp. E2-BRE-01 TaxID=3069524 RepID=UPI0032FB3D70